MIIPSGGGGGRRGAPAVVDDGLINVSLGERALAGADRGPPLLGLGGQTDLRGEIPPEHRVDGVGEVLEEHCPVHGGYSLKKAVIHSVRGPRGPSASKGGGGGGEGPAGLLRLLGEAQAGQDGGLHRRLVLAALRLDAPAGRAVRVGG